MIRPCSIRYTTYMYDGEDSAKHIKVAKVKVISGPKFLKTEKELLRAYEVKNVGKVPMKKLFDIPEKAWLSAYNNAEKRKLLDPLYLSDQSEYNILDLTD